MIEKKGDNYFVANGISEYLEKYPKGVYAVSYNDKIGFYLTKKYNNFKMSDKEYDFSKDNVEYIGEALLKKENSNFLFNGVKGSGKSYSAKKLANFFIEKFDSPVVIIENYGSMNLDLFKFLTSIEQNVFFFLDEFEKKFQNQNEQQQLLSFMDGVYTTSIKKVFGLTTNYKEIDENFISRPSRIRYVLEFKPFCSEEFIRNFVREELNTNKEQEDKLIIYLSEKKEVTLDILVQICREIQNFGFDKFFSIGMKMFNIENKMINYKTYYCRSSQDEDDDDYTMNFDEFIETYSKKKVLYEPKYCSIKTKRPEERTEDEKAYFENIYKIEQKYDSIYSCTVRSSVPEKYLAPGVIFDGYDVVCVKKVKGKTYLECESNGRLFFYVIEGSYLFDSFFKH